MNPTITTVFLSFLLFLTVFPPSSSLAARNNPGEGYGVPGFSIPGLGSGGVPGFGGGNGWSGGYGGGYSGPHGGRSWSGVTRPTTVCTDKGPCYKKKLTCPAKCFKTWSKSGKNYGSGGGGGGCTIDCKKCVAYC